MSRASDSGSQTTCALLWMLVPSGDDQRLEVSVDHEGRLRKVTAIIMKQMCDDKGTQNDLR